MMRVCLPSSVVSSLNHRPLLIVPPNHNSRPATPTSKVNRRCCFFPFCHSSTNDEGEQTENPQQDKSLENSNESTIAIPEKRITHDDLLNLPFEQAHDYLSDCLFQALVHLETDLSSELKSTLLRHENDDMNDKNSNSLDTASPENEQTVQQKKGTVSERTRNYDVYEDTSVFFRKSEVSNEDDSSSRKDDMDGNQKVSERSFLFLKGIPSRPYYREVAKRVLILSRCYFLEHEQKQRQNDPDNDVKNKEEDGLINDMLPMQYRPLISAHDLGLTENSVNSTLYYLPMPTSSRQKRQKHENSNYYYNEYMTPSSCAKWLQLIKEDGIMDLLGIRQTAGTEPYLFPPSKSILLQASRFSHGKQKQKPESRLVSSQQKASCKYDDSTNHENNNILKKKKKAPAQLLTVAARARAKHAHRGETDQYFGNGNKGNNQHKNEAADAIVQSMIDNAVWINCHKFGGVQSPVLEVRVEEGYGARWSYCHRGSGSHNSNKEAPDTDCSENNVKFRGFLEPQMEDGFEKKWRH